MYISVAEAAKKFGLSKRRVQILCEEERIEGSKMISGVWLIPKDAAKPIDARYKFDKGYSDSMEYLTLNEVCERLSISTATAKNWIRLGKLKTENNDEKFSKDYIRELVKNIKSGKDNRLKSRRNKKAVSGKEIYKDYIGNKKNQDAIKKIIDKSEHLSEDEQRVLIANYAVDFYRQKKNSPASEIIINFKKSLSEDMLFKKLICDYVGDINTHEIRSHIIEEILEIGLEFSKYDDTLGCLYISLSDKGNRKKRGAYYTPKNIVTELLDSIFENSNNDKMTYCDPCCGTGNFLQGLLNRGININRIFGQDIDEESIKITRINLFLLNDEITEKNLYDNIKCKNTLTTKNNFKYSVVLGNPPWGYDFSKYEIEELLGLYKTAKKRGIESFNLFIEKAFTIVEEGGVVAYVLPESILTVASHKKIRKLILDKSSFEFLNYIGNIFSGVHCPAIILGLRADNAGKTAGCRVTVKNDSFIIMEDRRVSENFLPLNMTDEEYYCLNHIDSLTQCVYLKGNADFALGIVTGDNKKYIKNQKLDGYETILRGSDIYRYGIREASEYINFLPHMFQQVAPTEIYRADEKLLYRFISEVPVFTYDNHQTLSLNSCNILIPRFKNLDIKYILAILNSRISAYYMIKKFNSIKRLRTHLESLPIPVVSKEIQRSIIKKVDCLLNGIEKDKNYEELDCEIMKIYGFNEEQQKIVKEFLKNKNLFLE